jgi:carotenoid cleavage dioxygenase
MKDLKEIISFLLGFMPWILFLFFSGQTFTSLERSILIGLLASLIFGFRELRGGFLLQWGTLIFFLLCAVTVNGLKWTFVAQSMGIISNGFLALLIWWTLMIGKPFTLQYARAELPKEQWNDPALIQSCRFLAVVWAFLLTFLSLVAAFKSFKPGLYPDGIYFGITIAMIAGGVVFTTVYKKYKRSQRA